MTKKIAYAFLILITSSSIFFSHDYAKEVNKLPEYLKPGLFFFYNGTLKIMSSASSLTVKEAYNVTATFIYNFTVLNVSTYGEIVVREVRYVYNNSKLLWHWDDVARFSVFHTHAGEFFMLPGHIEDERALEFMVSVLAFILPKNRSISYVEINYTSPLYGTIRAVNITIHAWHKTPLGINNTGVAWTNVTGYIIISLENKTEGLLMETTLRYINVTILPVSYTHLTLPTN